MRASLLKWFDANQRDLPWRRDRSPYAVWVSEIMLQQTQVATVIPYFLRFLARFPNPAALAAAPLEEVLAQWKGLGYYSRARNLHRAAQLIASQGMPDTAAKLRELPGLGRYTAAAVASLAFGEKVAVLDGNVARVLARLGAIAEPLEAPAIQKVLWQQAEELLDPGRPGAFNEAMMELGALVCSPGEPGCLACPLSAHCRARQRGLQARIPAPKQRAARKKLDLACAVVRKGEALLVARREESGLFGGLWELPCAEIGGEKDARSGLAELGLRAIDGEPIALVRRTLTHRDLSLHLLRCRAPRGKLPGYLEQRFASADQLQTLGISTAMARAIERALNLD